MRLLFDMDKKDYDKCTHSVVRHSARSIIIKGKKIAMIYNSKRHCYEFPGGGIEHGETPVDAMIRETREEAGLVVLHDTVKEYGYVHRIQRSDRDETECFIQDNYYYLCRTEDNAVSQQAEEIYTLEYIEPDAAIRKNRHAAQGMYHQPVFIERDTRILGLLIAEGMFEP